jgi:hypothetical protein
MNLVVFIYSELNYRNKTGYSMFAIGSGVFKLLNLSSFALQFHLVMMLSTVATVHYSFLGK